MDNDLITLTLVRIKTKQHMFFLAYKTNSSSPITKNKENKKTRTKIPQTNQKDRLYSCVVTVSTSSFVQVISVLTKRTSWCCGSRERQRHWSQDKRAGGDKKSEKLNVRLTLNYTATLQSWRNTFSAQLFMGRCSHDENKCDFHPNHTPQQPISQERRNWITIPGLNLLSHLVSSFRMVIKPLKGQTKGIHINTVPYLNCLQYVMKARKA